MNAKSQSRSLHNFRLAIYILLLFLVIAVGASAQTAPALPRGAVTVTLLPDWAAAKVETSPYAQIGTSTITVQDKYTDGGTGEAKKRTSALLAFDWASIPAGAKLVRMQLRLLQQDVQYPDSLTVRVAPVSCTDASAPATCKEATSQELENAPHFASSTEKGAWDAFSCTAQEECNLRLFESALFSRRPSTPQAKELALQLVPGDSKTGRSYYYSPDANEVSANTSLLPRLIVTYTLAAAPPPQISDWQSDGWPNVRSNERRNGIFTNDPQPQLAPAGLMVAPAAWQSALYVLQKRTDRSGKEGMFLDKISLTSPAIAWSREMPSNAVSGSFVVVNKSGRLSVVIGRKIIAYQLTSNEPIEIIRKDLPEAAPRLQAVVPGPDGSLYITGDGAIYALNPALRMIWRRSIDVNPAPRMTLNPDGQFLYAAGTVARDTPGLQAINAQTGRAEDFALPRETRAFQMPVVVRHRDGADFVFVAANSIDNGLLLCLKNVPTVAPDAETGIAPGDTVAHLEKAYQLSGLSSQPILDNAEPGDLQNKYLYYVRGEGKAVPNLMRIRCLDGNSEGTRSIPMPVLPEIWTKGNPVMFPDGLLMLRTQKLMAIQTVFPPSRPFAMFAIEFGGAAAHWGLMLSEVGGFIYETDPSGSVILKPVKPKL
jgi:hypothetical protein